MGEHRLSTESYIKWGRTRSEIVLMNSDTILHFGGRENTISSLLNDICGSIVNPSAKKPIHFIHAPPGVGKTSLFLEMIKMGSEDQKRLLLHAGAYDAEEKIALIDDILHIAVSFSGCTPYDGIHIKATNIPSILSHNFLRIMHIWLTNIGLNELFLVITTALAAGELTDQLSVLSMVARRAGRIVKMTR